MSTASGWRYTAPSLDLTTPPQIPADPTTCLTQAIYYEARNESEEGQAAVGEVVINRSRSGFYPTAICEVVYQRNRRTCQFTFTCDGAIGRSAIDPVKWGRAERIARDLLTGQRSFTLPPRSLNYHAHYVSPSWGRRLERVTRIGAHIFYGSPLLGGESQRPGATAGASPASGLVFVRNDALDAAYRAIMDEVAAESAPAAPTPSAGQP